MHSRKRILIFVDWFQPGFKAGGPIRSVVNFVNHLKDYHELFVVTGDRDIGDLSPYQGVTTNSWLQVDQYKVFYAEPGYLGFNTIRKIIRDIIPDWIYINGMFSLPFSILPVIANRYSKIRSLVLLAPRGMLKQSALEFKRVKKRFFLSFYKFLHLNKAILFQATSNEEAADIKKAFGKNSKVILLPNFPGFQKKFAPVTNKIPGELKVIFIGRIHPIKNLDYAIKILSEVRATMKFTIVGAIDDVPYWNKCERMMDQYREIIQIKVLHGVANHLLEEIILQHHIFILPTLGENFGHAIFESLAAGRPVLISDQTPWRHLEENKAGWDVPLEDVNRFKSIIEDVAGMDDPQINEWCKGAWDYCYNFLKDSDPKQKYQQLFAQ